VEGGTKGLELVSYVSGASRLLILDAVEVSAPAGTILRLDGQALASLPGSGSVHELAVADILVALRMLGCEPQETVLLGVQPEKTELGTSLSPRIEAAVPALVEAALGELSRWGCGRSSASGARDASRKMNPRFIGKQVHGATAKMFPIGECHVSGHPR
jgi:hydrogenase maturation protease